MELMLYDRGIYDEIWFPIQHEGTARRKGITEIKIYFRTRMIEMKTNIEMDDVIGGLMNIGECWDAFTKTWDMFKRDDHFPYYYHATQRAGEAVGHYVVTRECHGHNEIMNYLLDLDIISFDCNIKGSSGCLLKRCVSNIYINKFVIRNILCRSMLWVCHLFPLYYPFFFTCFRDFRSIGGVIACALTSIACTYFTAPQIKLFCLRWLTKKEQVMVLNSFPTSTAAFSLLEMTRSSPNITSFSPYLIPNQCTTVATESVSQHFIVTAATFFDFLSFLR